MDEGSVPPLDATPLAVVGAAWVAPLVGGLAAYATFRELAWLPPSAFPAPKPVAVLAPCAAVALSGFVLMLGLLAGRRWAWFGSLNLGLLAALAGVDRLVGRLWSGYTLGTSLGPALPHAALFVLSAVLLALLWLPGTRRWLAATHRLREVLRREIGG
jgi:hypothetical protein